MFLKNRMKQSTTASLPALRRLQKEIDTAEAIIIGAGAGLSASAGFTYAGTRFQTYFSDFEQKYGFHDMYSGAFYPYGSAEAYWAYWSRLVYCNRYDTGPSKVYLALRDLLNGKDCFVITTNVDHQFQLAGFEKRRLFYTQGDYGLFQCAAPCCRKTFRNEESVRRMVAEQKDMRVPSGLIPRCPECGGPMAMNLRSDNHFVEDDGWQKAAHQYGDFIRRHKGARTFFLELGVGYNTPGIIKYPFWSMVLENKRAVYACLNQGEAACPKEIEGQSICLDMDIGLALEKLSLRNKSEV